MNTQSFSFDVSKQPLATPTLYLGQGDKNGTTLAAAIYDNGVPLTLTNYSVRFSMRLPDDVSYYSVNGTVACNVATIPINEEYAAVYAGQTDTAYVEVFSGSTLICSTNRINVVILPSAEANADPGSAFSDEITAATERANEAAEAAEGVILQSMPTMSTTIKGGAVCGDGLKMTGDSVGVDEATSSRIDAIVNDENPQGSEAITITGLNRFWTKIKQAFAEISHVHSADDITSGILPIARGGTSANGTTSTTNIEDIITPATGVTITAAAYSTWGKVAMLVIVATDLESTTGSINIGTVASGKRPVSVARGDIASTRARYVNLTTAGVLTAYYETVPLSGSSVSMTVMYLLA